MAVVTIGEAFAPPTEAWQRVSPRLATAWRLTTVLIVVPVTAVLIVIFAVQSLMPGVIAVSVVAVVVLGWLWWLLGRRVASFGYVERDDDLLVTSGVMFKRLVIVPYGRMQLVEVSQGPIERAYGLSTVQLVTSSTSGTVIIPGLDRGDATALRDRLIASGEQQQAGI